MTPKQARVDQSLFSTCTATGADWEECGCYFGIDAKRCRCSFVVNIKRCAAYGVFPSRWCLIIICKQATALSAPVFRVSSVTWPVWRCIVGRQHVAHTLPAAGCITPEQAQAEQSIFSTCKAGSMTFLAEDVDVGGSVLLARVCVPEAPLLPTLKLVTTSH